MDFFAHPTAVIDEGCKIGGATKIWHFSHIMSGAVIGENCTLGQNVSVSGGVIIGNKVKIQNNVSLFDGVICEDEVFLGPSTVFTNIRHPRSVVSRRHLYQKTIVKKGATVGANATVLCGIEIGEFALVGAGTVVTKSVVPYALVVGNPGRQIGWVSEFGHQLSFNSGIAECPESNQQYVLENDRVKRVK